MSSRDRGIDEYPTSDLFFLFEIFHGIKLEITEMHNCYKMEIFSRLLSMSTVNLFSHYLKKMYVHPLLKQHIATVNLAIYDIFIELFMRTHKRNRIAIIVKFTQDKNSEIVLKKQDHGRKGG